MKISHIFTVQKFKLYSVQYEQYAKCEFDRLFDNWNDIEYLTNFFTENERDLQKKIFNFIDVRKAVNLTIEEAEVFEDLLYDNIDKITFEPLSKSEITCSFDTERIKTKLNRRCWLRLYAVKVKDGIYVISGGAIKLTKDMQDRPHTNTELTKLNIVKNYLIKKNYLEKELFD